MQRHGLQLESPLGKISLRHVKATETPADIGVVDIVVFAVKLYDIENAAAAVVPLVGPGTRVVTLLNGIDSVDALARFLPRSQVVGVLLMFSSISKGRVWSSIGAAPPH